MLSNVAVVRSSPSEASTCSSPASSPCTTPDDDAGVVQLVRRKAARLPYTDAFAIRLAEQKRAELRPGLAPPRRVPVPAPTRGKTAGPDQAMRQGGAAPTVSRPFLFPGAWPAAAPRTLLPAAMTRAPRAKGKYWPLDDAQQRGLGLAHRYAVLLGTLGAYAFTRAHAQGSYGKVHLARLCHGELGQGAGEPLKLAIKVQRLEPKAGKARLTQGLKTFEASARQVVNEFEAQQNLRRKVNELADTLHDGLLPQGSQTLRAYVPRELSSHVYELVFDHGHKTKDGASQPKAYLVSTCELGDAHALYRHLWALQDEPDLRRLRREVARSYAYQTFVELHVLHVACRKAHLDIKASNAHVNEAGGFRLADLGYALPTDDSGIVDARGPRGTLATYEMYPPAYFDRVGHGFARLHAHTDVMTNWVTALQFLVPPSVPTPFLRRAYFDEEGREHVDDGSSLAELQAFLRVLEEEVQVVKGRPRLVRLASGQGFWPPSGNRVVDQFFRAVAAGDVELFELALAYGMGYSPTGRARAYEQAQHVGALLGAADAGATAQLRGYFAAYAFDPERQQRFAELSVYAQRAAEAPRLGTSVVPPLAAVGPQPAPAMQAAALRKVRAGPAVVAPVVPRVQQGGPVAGGASLLA